jgi:hypothetical protein
MKTEHTPPSSAARIALSIDDLKNIYSHLTHCHDGFYWPYGGETAKECKDNLRSVFEKLEAEIQSVEPGWKY